MTTPYNTRHTKQAMYMIPILVSGSVKKLTLIPTLSFDANSWNIPPRLTDFGFDQLRGDYINKIQGCLDAGG